MLTLEGTQMDAIDQFIAWKMLSKCSLCIWIDADVIGERCGLENF